MATIVLTLGLTATVTTPPFLAAKADPVTGTRIQLFAGTGNGGHSGDGGPATSALIRTPDYLALDPNGDVYFSERTNYDVRMVDTDGTIHTFAGIGSSGAAVNDGGPATSGGIELPAGLALDNQADLFIADSGHGRVRKVNATGTISTIAGGGTQTGDSGPALSAYLSSPVGLALDTAGNVYVSEAGAGRVRKIDTAGHITTVAGNGCSCFGGDGGSAISAGLNEPTGINFDGDGNLYIADSGNNRIRKVTPSGTITTVAGNGNNSPVGATDGDVGDGGQATAAQIADPTSVAVDGAGNLFIGESFRVREVDTSGVISTVAGTGSAQGAHVDGGLALSTALVWPNVDIDDQGNLYITEPLNYRVWKLPAAAPSGTPVAEEEVTAIGSLGPQIKWQQQVDLPNLVDQVRSQFGNRYAGSYVGELANSFALFVGVVGKTLQDTQSLATALGPSSASVQLYDAAASETQLQSYLKAAGDAVPNASDGANYQASYIDPAANHIVVELTAPAPTYQALVTQTVPSQYISFNVVETSTAEAVDSRYTETPYKAGRFLLVYDGSVSPDVEHYCTAGYVLTDSYGDKYPTTAGHCGPEGGEAYMPDRSGVYLGSLFDNDFWDQNPSYSDSTLFFSGQKISSLLFINKNLSRKVIGHLAWSDLTTGTAICQSGRVSNITCGKVLNQYVGPRYIQYYRDADHQYELRYTYNHACWSGKTATGDSGGPVYYIAGDTTARAVGLNSYINVDSKNRWTSSCFNPMSNIEDSYGLHVLKTP